LRRSDTWRECSVDETAAWLPSNQFVEFD